MDEETSLVESYEKVCEELACKPMPEFLTALETDSSHCCISSLSNSALEDSVSVYALLSLLPYTAIQELEITNSVLSPQAWLSLLDACGKSSNLRGLSLKSCNLGSIDAPTLQQLAYGLSSCGLSKLDLCGNQLSDSFISDALEGGLLRGASSLTVSSSGASTFAGCWNAAAVAYSLNTGRRRGV